MASGRIALRRARADDTAYLSIWDLDADAIASNPNDAGLTDWASEIAASSEVAEVLIAEEDGRPVGAIVAIDPAHEPTHYWGDCEENLRAFDIWIGDARDRGRGVGAEMMRLAVMHAFADPKVKAILIDPLESNRRAIRFYERAGFRAIERRRFGEDDCLIMRLDRSTPA